MVITTAFRNAPLRNKRSITLNVKLLLMSDRLVFDTHYMNTFVNNNNNPLVLGVLIDKITTPITFTLHAL